MKFLSFFFLSFFIACSSHAITKDELVNFVNKAKQFAMSSGKASAVAEFSKTSGDFVQGELYIFATDFSGTILAHGAKPALAGKSLMAVRDTDGNEMIKEMVNVASTEGTGYVSYRWEHPEKKKVMRKLTYVTKIDDSYWIAAGIYSDE